MGQNNDGRKRAGGKHFNWDERVRLEALVRGLFPEGREPDFKRLGRQRSSVSREYKRGRVVNLDGELRRFPAYLHFELFLVSWVGIRTLLN